MFNRRRRRNVSFFSLQTVVSISLTVKPAVCFEFNDLVEPMRQFLGKGRPIKIKRASNLEFVQGSGFI